MNKVKKFFASLAGNQMIIPLAALLILVVFNLIKDPSFFRITLSVNSDNNPVLNGYLITILDFGSELAILSLGMTLVTAASGGQDISVGATIAIAGSIILRILCGADARADVMEAPVLLAFLVAVLASMAFGAFNGVLVSYFKIQPMVATLILFTAGRSIAAWINENRIPVLNDKDFLIYGLYIPGIPIPTPIFITLACMIVMALLLKFSNLGLYCQAVGINENTSRLNGINPKFIKFLTFVILGVCVAVCGLIKASRTTNLNYSTCAKDIEMDAILAVALGGNALGGGKFNMKASVLGAYVIQFLMTTLYKMEVRSDSLSAYKAVVVIILVILSAPVVREKLSKIFKKKAVNAGKEMAA